MLLTEEALASRHTGLFGKTVRLHGSNPPERNAWLLSGAQREVNRSLAEAESDGRAYRVEHWQEQFEESPAAGVDCTRQVSFGALVVLLDPWDAAVGEYVADNEKWPRDSESLVLQYGTPGTEEVKLYAQFELRRYFIPSRDKEIRVWERIA